MLACAEPIDDATECGGDPVLMVGKGETAYAPMESDGGTIELVHGPQGGFHTVIALEARGLDASAEWRSRIQGLLAGEVRAEASPYVNMRCNPDTDTLQAWGFLLVWDAQPEELDGQLVLVEAEVTDASGAAASDEAEVTIEDPLVETP